MSNFALPESVSNIGIYGFYGDNLLKEIYIPDAMTSISNYTFYGCTNISKITIGHNVTSIGSNAFKGCTGLEKISIPNKVASIGSSAFAGCTSAKTLTIPSSVTSIGGYAFSGCNKIETVNIPNSVRTLGEYAFAEDGKISDLTIGSGLSTINQNTFQNCVSLIDVTVPNNVTTINASAFYGCSNLKSITLPFVGMSRTAKGYYGNIGYIFGFTRSTNYGSFNVSSQDSSWERYDNNGNGCYLNLYPDTVSSTYYSYYSYNSSYHQVNYYTVTFNTPSSLKTVNITDATRISEAAFNGATTITDISLNDGITSVEPYAFKNCKWYDNQDDEFVVIGDNTLIKYNGKTSTVIIPGEVKHIGTDSFRKNTDISNVTLPEELNSIDTLAFDGCTYLGSLTIPKSVISIGKFAIPSTCAIRVWCPSAGYDYRTTNRTVLNSSFTTGNDKYYYVVDENNNAAIVGCETTSTELTIPEYFGNRYVNRIDDYGFSNCSSLNSITIPSNIVSIGDYAFQKCTGLISATIPTTVKEVGEYAFLDCENLTYVTISEGVESIGKGAFKNCTSLIEAVVPDTASYLGSHAFYNCTSLTTATIGITAESVGDYTFYGCKKLDTVVIGLSVKSIGDYAFYNCALTKVTTPNSTEIIGKYAFAKNTHMTKATLKRGLVTIDDYAFVDCTTLNTVSFPVSLVNIKEGSFKNCRALATMTLPSELAEMGKHAFENCTSLPGVVIPSGVTVINDYVFCNCSSMSTVIMSGDVSYIGIKAFYNNAFAEMSLPETVLTIKKAAFKNCSNLESIVIPDTTDEIAGTAFEACTSMSTASIPDCVNDIGIHAFYNNNDITIYVRCVDGIIANDLLKKQGVSHVVIDENITAIGDRAFAYDYYLETITYGNNEVSSGEYLLSSNIESIGTQSFMDDTRLKNLKVPDTLETVGENVFYNENENGYKCSDVTVTFYYVNGEITSDILKGQKASHIYISDNIFSIGNKAFSEMSILESVSIPDTIVSCGNDVFTMSSGKVTAYFRKVDGIIDDSVYDGKTKGIAKLVFDEKLDTIGTYSFANSKTITEVIIKDTDLIDDYAFYRGTVLSKIYIEKTQTIDAYTFAENKQLTNVEIVSSTSINDYAFYNDIAINTLYLDEDLIHIGNHAFEECKLVPDVELPDTVREIGSYAFYNCNSMTAINIPEGVSAINDYTFFGCASLLAACLPNSVESIGDYAYYGDVLINSLDIGDSVKSIGEYAFYNCNAVTQLILPDTLKSIDDYAFRGCSGLTAITVPDSVETIGDCIFYGCTGLKDVEFGTGIVSIGDRVFYACVDMESLLLNGEVSYIHDLAFYGVEDVTVYEFSNEYIENYCDENDIRWVDLNTSFEMTLTPPTKIDYYEGEELNYEGLSIFVVYANGMERTTTAGYTVSGYDNSVAGVQTITVNYHGKTATFNVNVSHIASEPVIDNIVAPTCDTDGSYDTIIYCSKCNSEISRETTITPKIGHDYSITYEWSEDGKSCVATAICKNDSNHIVNENGTVSSEVKTPATCLDKGTTTYTASFTNELFETKSKDIEDISANGHSFTTYVSDGNATCLEDGTKTAKCDNCIETDTITDEGSALGHDIIHHEGKLSTCKEKGYKSYDTCSRCDYTTYEELPLADHTPAEAVKENETAATCTVGGSYDSVVCCSVCGEEISREKVDTDPLGHDKVQHDGKTSTCKEHGWKAYETCSRCDYTTFEELPLADHTPAEEAVKENEVAATCTAGGSYDSVIYCSICGEEISREKVDTDPLGHDKISHDGKASTCKEHGYKAYETCSRCDYTTFEELPLADHTPSEEAVKENEVVATCTVGGSYESVIYCSICGEQISRETVETDPLGHDKVSHEGKASTCNEHGYNAYETCSRCDYTTFEELPLADHTPAEAVEENRKASTCKEIGSYDSVVYCSVCGEEISRNKIDLPLADHTPAEEAVKENEVASTCTAGGSYESVIYCSICGEQISREKIDTDPLGHDKISHDGKASTCKEHGWKAYETCSRCDYTTFEELPLADHTPAEPVKENEVASTHTAYGSYESVVYCSVCGIQISRETVETEPLGHSYSKSVTAPTCTENGYTTYTCSCGDTYKGNWVAPLGHDTITHDGKASTCKVRGYKAYETCSRCDYTTFEELPLADHTPAEEAVKENEVAATCTEGGSYDSVIYCTVCGNQISREKVDTDPLGHDKISHDGQASTCKDHGWKAYETCSRCDYTTFEELPLGDHSPAPFKVENSTESTCKKAGEYDEVVYCSVCGDELSREHKVRELGNHAPLDPVKENEVAATCTKGGSYDSVIKCGVCGDELSREKITTNPAGHTYTEVVTAPTCTERGFTTYTCHCGDSYVDNYKDALGHSFTNYKYNNDATTERDGTETAKCDRCTETYTRTKPGTKIVNPTASARLNVKTSQTVDYKSNVIVTATASGVPTGYVLAIYEGNTFRTQGDNTKVSYPVGQMTAGRTFTVKVIDPSTKVVQKDSSGAELSKNCEVKVKTGFFDKLIAFFKGLFGALPNVEVKP